MSQTLPCSRGVPSPLTKPCQGLHGFIEGFLSLFLESEWVRRLQRVYGKRVRMEPGF